LTTALQSALQSLQADPAVAAALDVLTSGALRAILGEDDPVARVVDLGTVIDVLRGKLEFESGEEGRELVVLEHLLHLLVLTQ
jgi:magnesium chelatase subunit I